MCRKNQITIVIKGKKNRLYFDGSLQGKKLKIKGKRGKRKRSKEEKKMKRFKLLEGSGQSKAVNQKDNTEDHLIE